MAVRQPQAASRSSALPDEIPPLVPSWRILAAELGSMVLALVLLDLLMAPLPGELTVTIVRDKWARSAQAEAPVDWLVLGDSSGLFSLRPAVFGEAVGGRALNLCTVASFLCYGDAWLLDRYLQHAGAPRHVVLVHTLDFWPRDFGGRTVDCFAALPEPWGFWSHMDPPAHVSRRLQLEAFKERHLPLLSRRPLLNNELARRLGFAAQPPAPPSAPDASLAPDLNLGWMSVLEAEPRQTVRGELEAWREAPPPFSFTPDNLPSLETVDRLAAKHGFDVYLVHGPLPDELRSAPGYAECAAARHAALQSALAAMPHITPVEQQLFCSTAGMQSMDHPRPDAAGRYSRQLGELLAGLRTGSR